MDASKHLRSGQIPTRNSLLARLKDWDDHVAWKEFFDAYGSMIYCVARRAGLEDADAQEVVQETVLSVAKGVKQFRVGRENGSFKAWVLTVVRRRIADQVRRRPFYQAHAAHRGTGQTSRTNTVDRIPDPNGLGLEKLWDQEWNHHRMVKAMDRLKRKVSAKQWQIFQMLTVSEMPASEVARTLGVTRSLVYVTKHRLSVQLKRELRILGGEGP